MPKPLKVRLCPMVLFLLGFLGACNIGKTVTPVMDVFEPDTYLGSRTMLSVAVAPDGVRYFGGSQDVYRYTGYEFETIPLEGQSDIRDLFFDAKSNKLWCGSNEDVGYIDCSQRPFLFQSVKLLMPANYQHSATWSIDAIGDVLYFTQKDGLVILKNGEFEYHRLETPRRLISHVAGSEFYVQQRGVGLLRWNAETSEAILISSDERFQTDALVYFQPMEGGHHMAVFATSGAYIFDGKALVRKLEALSECIQDYYLICSSSLDNNRFLFGTVSQGLIIVDIDGNLIQRIHTDSGSLSNLFDRCMAIDDSEIWAMSRNGMLCLRSHELIERFGKADGISNEVQAIDTLNHQLLVGTYGGLVLGSSSRNANNPLFTRYAEHDSLIWEMRTLADCVILGTASGIQQLSRNGLAKVGTAKADTMAFCLEDDYLLAGTYYGLTCAQLNGAGFQVLTEIDSLPFMPHSLSMDGQYAWVGTMSNGLYRVKRSAMLEPPLTVDDFEPIAQLSDQWCRVDKIQNHLIAVHPSGFYQYQDGRDRFVRIENAPDVPDTKAYLVNFANAHDDSLAYCLVSRDSGELATRNQLYRITVDDNRVQVDHLDVPHLSRLGEIFTIYVDEEDPQVLWVGGSEGLSKIDLKHLDNTVRGSVFIDHITLAGQPIDHDLPSITIPHSAESLRFGFSCETCCGTTIPLSTRLDGLQKNWSPYSFNGHQEYTNLFEGNYTLLVEGTCPNGHTIQPASISFRIAPPPCRTGWAYAGYTLCAGFAIFLFIRSREMVLKKRNLELEQLVSQKTRILESTNLELIKANEAKAHFISRVSHEIRNPMHGIFNLAFIIKEDAPGNVNPEDARQLCISATYLRSLLDEILDFSKLDIHSYTISEKSFQLETITEQIASVYGLLAAQKHIGLHIDSDRAYGQLFGDDNTLKQVLMNLIGNAIKFTQQGHVTLRIRTAEENGDQIILVFEIVDTGPGISENERAQIFRPFYQIKNTGQSQFSGTGLGLAICHEMLALHQQPLEFESTPGEGSTFMFKMRFRELKSAATKTVSNDAIPQWADMQYTVLIVEDLPYNMRIITKFLQDTGIKVVSAGCVHEAKAAADGNRLDMVLSDIDLPDGTGFEVIRHIKEAREELPVVAMTAFNQAEDRSRYIDAGFDAILAKPFTRGEVYRLLGDYIAADAFESEAGSGETIINGLRMTIFAELSDGDSSTFKRYLDQYIEEFDELMEELEATIPGEVADVRRVLHKMLAFAHVEHAAQPISDNVEAIKSLVIGGDKAGALDYMTKFRSVWDELKSRLLECV